MIIVMALLWSSLAVSYDLFSGYCGRINMGYAMFPGLGGYTTAFLNTALDWPSWLSAAVALLSVIIVATIFAHMTLKIQGIYFALATSIFPMVLIGLTNLFSSHLGGEDGIYGVSPLVNGMEENILVATVTSLLVLSLALWLVRNKTGLVLRAVQGGQITAETLGWNTSRLLIIMFVISGALGGLVGIILTHYQMIVTHDLLFVTATLQIIMFAQVGGSGTILGPFIAGLILVGLETNLQAWSTYRPIIFFSFLVLSLRFLPGGVASIMRKTSSQSK